MLMQVDPLMLRQIPTWIQNLDFCHRQSVQKAEKKQWNSIWVTTLDCIMSGWSITRDFMVRENGQ